MRKIINYFTRGELILWGMSVLTVAVSFFAFSNDGYMTLFASLIGVTAIIVNAKGNPAGQAMMIVFSIFYGIISFDCAYYGEMFTYLGMTAPMALMAFISWIKNLYGDSREVKVNKIKRTEIIFMFILTAFVSAIFYFLLKYFHTANLIPSTFSVTTSFIAVYLTFRRSAYFSLAYASNDIILIVLWTLASLKNISYVSVLMCFVMFFVNDIYGFISWRKMEKRQFSESI